MENLLIADNFYPPSLNFTGSNLPTHLRFLITARPEKDILDSLPSGLHIVHKELMDVPQDVVDKDIETYFYYHSEHLFQWAATVLS